MYPLDSLPVDIRGGVDEEQNQCFDHCAGTHHCEPGSGGGTGCGTAGYYRG